MPRNDDFDRPTRPEHRDIHLRHGLLMRDVAELRADMTHVRGDVDEVRGRVEALERLNDAGARAARSIRPKVERFGWSVFVAAIVTGIVQGIAALMR